MSRTISQRSVRCGHSALMTAIAFVFVACAGSGDSAETSVVEPTAAPVDTTTNEPAATEPAVTEPAATEPAATEPAVDSVPLSVAVPSTEPEVEGVVPDGFTTTMARITKADGTVCDVCLWLADEPAERNRGLMGVTDLGGAQGMIFTFEQPTLGEFFMFQTVTPLSIAWFSPDGALVSTADMEPCLTASSAPCERYAPGGIYQSAIEVFQGDLDTIGIGEGSSVEITVGTEAIRCPLGDQ